ncbi:MAG: hypothetical protein K5857_06325 [Lachnospiraceae bacterium]|nr:hypothetical protein [Lachnospiraceae bacterium]
MQNKHLKILFTVFAAALVLSGCGKKSDIKDTSNNGVGAISFGEPEEGTQDTQKPSDETGEEDDLNLNGKDLQREIDLSSEDVILEFLSGEWTMINRKTREDFGTLRIGSRGTIDFVRTKDDASGYGTISFSRSLAGEDEAPDAFHLEFDDMRDLVPREALPGEDVVTNETGGIFHIGIGEDKDYLYLKEIGNGDTMISLYAFNVNENVNDPEGWDPEWLFVRDSSGHGPDVNTEEGTFYAWAWERDSDGVWLQPMTLYEYETEDEYTGRRFTGGYFSEKKEIDAGYYQIAGGTDVSGLLEMDRWSSEYPLMIYEISLDKKGKISGVSEVDRSYYNIYDMGDIEPEYSYEGTKFKVNGSVYDVQDFAKGANAIMDCTRMGDWIIVDCHVNPHYGIYEFYNLNSGDFEYDIQGTNLTWHGDDLSTAVYSRYNQVFDFWGHMLASVDEGEIYGLRWIDEETVGAECWVVDEIGREKEYTYKIEYRPQDRAVLSYYEYMLGGTRQWRRFMEEMPDGAAALVMVNPPQCMLDKMGEEVVYDPFAYDRLAVVSLMDDVKLHINRGKVNESEDDNFWGKLNNANRGQATVFEITVPEGAPGGTLVVSTPNSGEILWDIVTISGESAVMSKFLTIN